MERERLEEEGFELIDEGTRLKWDPDEKAIHQCVDFGRKLIHDIDT